MKRLLQQSARFVMQWEWLWLLLLLPFLLFPNGPQAWLLLLVPLLWLLRWLASATFVPVTPYNGAITLLMLMVLVSLYATFDIELSMPKIAGMVLGVALFYGAIAYGRSHQQGLWHLTTAVLLAGVGMSIVGLVGTPWRGPFAFLNQVRQALPLDITIPGTVSGAINPNEMAGVLNWLLPLAVALLVGAVGRLRRQPKLALPLILVLGSLAAVWGIMLLATYSRGGTAAFVISLLVMMAIASRGGRLLLVTAVILTAALAYQYNLLQLLLGDSAEIAGQIGLNGRIEIWSRALYGLQDFPFTGMSMNGFRQVVHILYPLFLISPTTDLGHAHNHLLQAGLDLGLPGLIAYLALWFISATLLWSAWRQAQAHSFENRTEDEGPKTEGRYPSSGVGHPSFKPDGHPMYGYKLLIIGLTGSLTAGWFFGILDAIALGARPGFLWWLLLALVVLVHESVNVESEQ
ncbi:MAG: O-antigen ligase family protein [Chloroflexota bacterium]